MSGTPLLTAFDDADGSERFIVAIVDFGAGQLKQTSRALTEDEACALFTDRGETASDIAKRFQSARDNKGRV